MKKTIGLLKMLIIVVSMLSFLPINAKGITTGTIMVSERYTEPQYSFDSSYFGAFKSLLISQGYSVIVSKLVITSDLLSGIDVLIVNLPRTQYSSKEIDAIEAFVLGGGGLFCIADHSTAWRVDNIIARWGFSQASGYVVDQNNYVGGNKWWVYYERSRGNFATHPITNGLTRVQSAASNWFLNELPKGAVSIITTDTDGTASPSGVSVYAALNVGTGRIVISMDSNYFGPSDHPMIGLNIDDNAALGLNTIAWLMSLEEGVPRILRVSPDRGGNTGMVTVRIFGVGFIDGAISRLTREGCADIICERITMASTYLLITTFNLTGAELGLWDVVVTLSNDVELRLPHAFTVEAGREPNLFVEIIGRGQIRVGVSQNYCLRITNRANVDLEGVFAILNLSDKAEYITLQGQTIDVDADLIDTETGKVLSIYIPYITAFQNIDLELRILAKSNPIIGITFAAFAAYAVTFIKGAAMVVVVSTAATFVTKLVKYLALRGYTLPEATKQALIDTFDDYHITLGFGALGWVIKKLLDAQIPGQVAIEVVIQVIDQFRREKQSSTQKNIDVVTAWDPNEKSGPTGFEPRGFIPNDLELVYMIYFENLENATAPAQKVVITDLLNENLDWYSFRFGEVSFGNLIIPVEQEVVDLRPDKNLLVKINKTINKTNGLVTWTFESLDPDTGLPPEDPLAGFLPPNKIPPEGEGWVKFYIYPKFNLLSGAEIVNQASIIFDLNPPIVTNAVLNTIDKSQPVSAVNLLPAESLTHFLVSWSGSDGDGSGIRHYVVYVSENDGPFIPWAIEEDVVPVFYTKRTSAIFHGKPGHTYSFYTIAVDNVGNVEQPPAEPDAKTTVFSWNYIFEDTFGRETILKINTVHNLFQFITFDKDYGVRNASYMALCGRSVVIRHFDSELRLISVAVDTKLDFCIALAWDVPTGKRYLLIDKCGAE
ncbi:MAG: hypothetical protein QXJ02_06160 [Candidatus Bathyarchaeia archaeon]